LENSKLIGLNSSISHQDFQEILNAISTADSVEELVSRLQTRSCVKMGSYHHIPAVGSYDYDRLEHFWSIGMSEEIKAYLKSKGTRSDPVMKTVLAEARPFWLSALLMHHGLSDGRSQHRINLGIKYMGDGILAPLFGPFNKRGYVFLGFKEQREFYEDSFLWQIQAILQATHIRYSMLVESLRTSIKLTNRESEVLELISFGKTNPEIGIILGISTSTVAGHVKNIFLKLNTNDRVTAALRAQNFTP